MFKKKKLEVDFEWRDFRDKSDEELDREAEIEYQKEVLKRNVKIGIITIIFLFLCKDIIGFWFNFAIPGKHIKTTEVIDVTAEPLETPLNEEDSLFIKYYTLEDDEPIYIRKQSAFSITGRVVAKNYLFWTNYLPYGKNVLDSTAIIDMGLAWGRLSDKEILKNYTFYSVKNTKERNVHPTLKLGTKYTPLPWPYVRTHLLNLNIIPANDKIMSALIHAYKYKPVKLEGYLVDIQVEEGRWLRSQRSSYSINANSRNGSSGIMYVTKVQIENKIYE